MKSKRKVTLRTRAEKAGLPASLVYNRVHRGWSKKKALSTPVNGYAKKSTDRTSTPKPTVKPVERKVPPTIPLPVEKYEAPKDKTLLYVVVACVVILVLAVITNT